MVSVNVYCPRSQSAQVYHHDQNPEGHDRFCCRDCHRVFQLTYAYEARKPGVQLRATKKSSARLSKNTGSTDWNHHRTLRVCVCELQSRCPPDCTLYQPRYLTALFCIHSSKSLISQAQLFLPVLRRAGNCPSRSRRHTVERDNPVILRRSSSLTRRSVSPYIFSISDRFTFHPAEKTKNRTICPVSVHFSVTGSSHPISGISSSPPLNDSSHSSHISSAFSFSSRYCARL